MSSQSDLDYPEEPQASNPVQPTQVAFNNIWSPEEDQLLLRLVRDHGFRWAQFEKQFPDRDRRSIQARYRQLRRAQEKNFDYERHPRRHEHGEPHNRHNPQFMCNQAFTPDEDTDIYSWGVENDGKGWETFVTSGEIQRSAEQCRIRYQNHICNLVGKDPWSPEEDKSLLDIMSRGVPWWGDLHDQFPDHETNQIRERGQYLGHY